MPPNSLAPIIAVDIGGCRTRMAVVRGDAIEEPTYCEISTAQFATGDDVVAALCGQAAPLARTYHPVGMAVSVPGLLNPDFHSVEFCPNTPALAGFPLRPRLTAALSLPVVLEVDCNAAALAEYYHGEGRGSQRLIVMSLGTGVGIGVVNQGRLVRITGGCCGDLGHVHVGGDRHCSAGCRGCLEANVSVEALAAGAGYDLGAAAVVRQRIGRAHEGDADALALFQHAGQAIGIALASLSAFLRPDLILLAGGISEAPEILINEANRSFAAYGAAEFRCPVRKGAFGANAALVGAGSSLISRWEEV